MTTPKKFPLIPVLKTLCLFSRRKTADADRISLWFCAAGVAIQRFPLTHSATRFTLTLLWSPNIREMRDPVLGNGCIVWRRSRTYRNLRRPFGPILYGDGKHDDTEALKMWFNNNRVTVYWYDGRVASREPLHEDNPLSTHRRFQLRVDSGLTLSAKAQE